MKDLVRRQLALSIATMQAVHDSDEIHDTMVEIGRLTADAMRNGKKLLVAGNGGSAADAQHLVAEFVVRLTVNRPALRAIALTTDTSILTATGNDFGYDAVFSRQIEALGQEGDVFLGISTSGNSPNILLGMAEARRLGLTTIGFTGNGGGKMREACDYNVIIPSTTTMNIQESHLALEHIFCMIVERFTFGMDFDKAPQIVSE
ncbi:D-sedoheptulose 7-phosphate isomerase [Granulicella tundricola]|uniref:Phosphoheptose isomerase n=1 Tax=Granulicella tundricola (strain ATCC BAA-1859 / DSM 23138 / MP5ACTX9) TaxID=1198114 RepID=E8X392_GRATM|nr:D-sedoheptulose 7-phosphate isomerase [Granulicella tundricola]ADW69316.1 sugar isomerase (SIS) [Granulicella tundricola MP5ACTX9]